jgi:hypothetical protein
MSLTAGGVDVWGTSDQFRFAYQQMTGDGAIVSFVHGFSPADAWTKAGVMIRDSMAANAPHAFMMLTGSNGVAFQRRKTAGGVSSHTAGPSTGTAIFVRLQRSGSTITGSYSWDGVNWATVGSDTISLGNTVYVGVALTSRSPSAYSTAYFSNPTISGGSAAPAPPAGNQAPQVSLTSPTTGATFSAPASISMVATASDPDGTVSVVEFYSGPYLLGSDTTSPYTFTWPGIPSGTYSLTAVARDTAGAMTVSSERTITVGNATSSRQAAFVPSANHATAVSQYVLNIYPAGADPNASNPVASVDLGRPALVSGEIRVDITSTVSGLPSGNYFATVTAVGPGGSATSAPSGQFFR